MAPERVELPDAAKNALLTAGERYHDRIVQSCQRRNRNQVGLFLVAVERVQVNGSSHDLAPGQPPQSFFATLRQVGEPAAALAQRPFEQRIMAAANGPRTSRASESYDLPEQVRIGLTAGAGSQERTRLWEAKIPC